MSKVAIGILAAAGLVVVIGLGLILGYISFTNEANRQEIGIKAQYDKNRNIYDNGWKSVMEMAQVPQMYAEQLKELYQDTLKGRYGANGSQAMMQFIQESNPQLPAEIYVKLQQRMEAFRTEFMSTQNDLVSRKQTYENLLTATTSGRFYNMIGGYPHIDLDKYSIVTSDKTEEDFERKRSEPLDINKK